MARPRAAGDDADREFSHPPGTLRKLSAFQSLRTQKLVPPVKYLDDFRQRPRGLAHLPLWRSMWVR